MIPKRAHFFWFGGEPPAWVFENVKTFQRLNPGWGVRLHRNWLFSTGFVRAVRGCHLWCQVADIAYCSVLRQYGGVVLDCDIVTLRSFDPLLGRGGAWTTKHPSTVGGARRLTNGVMGAEPGCAAMEQACDEITRIAKNTPAGQRFRRCEFGPTMLTRLFADGGMTILPHYYFYPWGLVGGEREQAHKFWHADEAERKQMLDCISDRFTDGERPFAVHLWGVDGSSNEEIPHDHRP